MAALSVNTAAGVRGGSIRFGNLEFATGSAGGLRWDGKEATREAEGRGSNPRGRVCAFTREKCACAGLPMKLMKEQAYQLKEEVAKMISCPSTSSLYQKVHLIYVLERLCLDYLFEEEINNMLAQISDADVNDCDLHTVSLWFYVLRSHGHRVSPGLLRLPELSILLYVY
ncbi:hypothetical protein C2845_PM02G12910 [Panicum miliaceum]|uniref:Terpene synthase N-terminal domain-containing protein n=1 Tax=Panicum miliaceum TaxID=4540 RepID=A0A3L6S8I4_PANMI|nr:hypothetical protein C2845_PM02G12910 [Panicum miliaceum]